MRQWRTPSRLLISVSKRTVVRLLALLSWEGAAFLSVSKGKMMKAIAVFPASREVKLIEQAEPVITQPGQVKLRILDIGICGTDKEICTFLYGTPPVGSDYLVIGHEALGEVVEVGAAVTHLKPDDLVVPTVRRP